MHPTLVLDLGSTSVKAALVEPGGAIAPIGERPTPRNIAVAATPARHESDPRVFVEAVRELMGEARAACPEVSAVAFSTQMHGAVLTDLDDAPVSPFLSWQDERAADRGRDGRSVLERVPSELPAETIRALGVMPRLGLGAFTMSRWLDEREEAGMGRPSSGRLHTLGSFVIARLGGPFVTHLSNGAPLGIVDIDGGTWSAGVVAALGLRAFDLPTIVEGYEAVGRVDVDGEAWDVFPDVGDHQASLIGSGVEPGDLAVSLGTAGIAARVVDGPAPAVAGVETRPHLGGRRLRVRSRLPGGRRAVEFAGDRAADPGFWAEASVAPAGTPAADFFAEYTEAYRDAFAALFPDEPPRRLVLNGGAARHIPWFRDRFAESLGLQAVEVPDADLAVLGVARLLEAAPGSTTPPTRRTSVP